MPDENTIDIKDKDLLQRSNDFLKKAMQAIEEERAEDFWRKNNGENQLQVESFLRTILLGDAITAVKWFRVLLSMLTEKVMEILPKLFASSEFREDFKKLSPAARAHIFALLINKLAQADQACSDMIQRILLEHDENYFYFIRGANTKETGVDGSLVTVHIVGVDELFTTADYSEIREYLTNLVRFADRVGQGGALLELYEIMRQYCAEHPDLLTLQKLIAMHNILEQETKENVLSPIWDVEEQQERIAKFNGDITYIFLLQLRSLLQKARLAKESGEDHKVFWGQPDNLALLKLLFERLPLVAVFDCLQSPSAKMVDGFAALLNLPEEQATDLLEKLFKSKEFVARFKALSSEERYQIGHLLREKMHSLWGIETKSQIEAHSQPVSSAQRDTRSLEKIQSDRKKYAGTIAEVINIHFAVDKAPTWYRKVKLIGQPLKNMGRKPSEILPPPEGQKVGGLFLSSAPTIETIKELLKSNPNGVSVYSAQQTAENIRKNGQALTTLTGNKLVVDEMSGRDELRSLDVEQQDVDRFAFHRVGGDGLYDTTFTRVDNGKSLTIEDVTGITESMNRDYLAGRTVVVNCLGGVSRSATIVVAYLIEYQNMTLEEAIKHVHSRRFAAKGAIGSFNREQRLFLLEFSAQIARKKLKLKPELQGRQSLLDMLSIAVQAAQLIPQSKTIAAKVAQLLTVINSYSSSANSGEQKRLLTKALELTREILERVAEVHRDLKDEDSRTKLTTFLRSMGELSVDIKVNRPPLTIWQKVKNFFAGNFKQIPIVTVELKSPSAPAQERQVSEPVARQDVALEPATPITAVGAADKLSAPQNLEAPEDFAKFMWKNRRALVLVIEGKFGSIGQLEDSLHNALWRISRLLDRRSPPQSPSNSHAVESLYALLTRNNSDVDESIIFKAFSQDLAQLVVQNPWLKALLQESNISQAISELERASPKQQPAVSVGGSCSTEERLAQDMQSDLKRGAVPSSV